MKSKELSIKEGIYLLRLELHDMLNKENVSSDNVQRISCELDNLINRYHKKQVLMQKHSISAGNN